MDQREAGMAQGTTEAAATVRRTFRGRKPRVMLMADVPQWIFARHVRVLQERLGDTFEFEIKFQGEAYREADYDLLYPLEWNLIPTAQIRTPAKYVTGIRSVVSWQSHDFLAFAHYLSRTFQRVHCVSDRLVRMFSPFVPGIVHLTHGIDTTWFTPHTRADRSGAGRLKIGWAGNRVNRSKGFEDLVAPLAKLPGVEIVHCGYLDQNLNADGMRWFYDTIDCYVCSSLHEGNNNSLMEAAAMQRAIITTDTGAVPEYLVHGQSALIVERELPYFLEAARTLRDDPALRVQLGARARDAVVAHFDWIDMAQRYADFFFDALEATATWQPPANAVQQAITPRVTTPPAPVPDVELGDLTLEEATARLETVLTTAPDFVEVLDALAQFAAERSDWAACAEYCRRVLILDAKRVEAVERLATALAALGDTARADAARDEAAKLRGPAPAVLNAAQEAAVREGAAALERGDLAAALAHYRRAQAAGPRHDTIEYILAELAKVATAT